MKIIILFVLLPLTLLLSQTNKQIVRGTIIDGKTKEPLVGANVLILNLNDGVSSDKSGSFYLFLNPGKYVLKISCIGYNSLIDTINITNHNNKFLRYELEEIEIRGTEEKVFVLTKEAALKDISKKQYRIFIAEYDDSIRTIIEKVAVNYGFKVYWPDDVYMIVSADQYNDTMIKYLEKQNGKGWYSRFIKDLDIALKSKY
jgi:hypothetical protein